MKDTEIMTEEEKRKYIFEDTRFEGRPHVKWITDCLLGDIRTFLDGIEYFKIQNKGKPAGKSPRGGGNLSVPILINTALEFVAELYTGKTDYMKFNTDIKFKKDLEVDKKVSEGLKREFTIRNFPLPKTHEITKTDKGWEIKDKDTDKTYYLVTKDKKKQNYLFCWDDVPSNNEDFLKFLNDYLNIVWAKNEGIEKNDDKTIAVSKGTESLTLSLDEEQNEVTLLADKKCQVFISQKKNGKRNIYEMKAKKLIFHFRDKEDYDATKNAKEFIPRYFPEEYKDIPSLLWDGIRNGLVHTFSPKPFTYKGSFIRFQFYVEDQNFPSYIEKVKRYLFGIDTDAKIETKLNDGDVPEELEDNFKTMGVSLPKNSTVLREKKYLFSMDIVLENELNDENKKISKGLKDVFRIKRFELDEKATKKKENDYKWEITDKKDIYIVKREEGKLNVYKKEEKKWEITNGVDTLYALEKEDKEKITVYNYIIQIRINVFELFRVLEKAVEAYLAELENGDDLQDKFIRAWSSIEEYTEKTDEKQEKEVNELNKCLDQKNHAFLLKKLNDQLSVDSLKIYSLNSLKVRRS